MKKKHTISDYEKRIHRVVDFIHDHLDEKLDIAKLAEISCFSPYHWHRIYKSLTGETAAQTVRRLRLHRASITLTRSDSKIEEVAKKAGYTSAQAFNRAFHKAYGLPPAAYRHELLSPFKLTIPTQEELDMYNVTIENLSPFQIIALHHVGSYQEVSKAWEQLSLWATSSGLLKTNPRAICIYHDDPNTVQSSELHSDVGFSIRTDFQADDKRFQIMTIKGGRYGVMRHNGSYAGLKNAYKWLYGTWLPQSGQQPACAPVIEEYVNNPKMVAPSELITKIYIPLEE